MASPALSELHVDFRAERRQPGNPISARQRAPSKHSQRVPDRSLFAHYITSVNARVVPTVFGISLIGSIVVGWLNHDETNLTPQSGLGYWLGIAGSSAMLLLLIYPFRKRLTSLRALGGVFFWFRAHMILGLVGPVLILFHSNFALGSLNSNVALLAMLTVATSGLVGRYLYAKIHLGLHGRKAAVQQILADADTLRNLICDGLPVSDHIIVELNSFAKVAMTPRTGVMANFWWMSVLSVRALVARKRLLAEASKLVRNEGKRLGWSRRMRRDRLAAATDHITLHLAAVKKAAAFAFYERLFALWHVLHLPLFILLILAAVAHVVAVHLY
jgi:hypothetical protein